MHTLPTFLALLLLLNVQPAWAGDVEDGVAAANRGDYANALRLWSRMAQQGDADAQLYLGAMYAKGLGVLQDSKQAIKWFQLAAQQGHARSQFFLATMYENGDGVAQNHNEAVKWYQLAAAQGHAAAQVNLGTKYAIGEGIVQNYVRAHMWLNLAAAQGDVHGIKGRDFAAKFMTAQQIAQAQEMAQQCLASNYKRCGDDPQIGGAPPTEQPLPPKRAQESRKSSGTGFYVSSDGYLITNEHVVNSCSILKAIDATGQKFPLHIVRTIESDDLALLKADTAPRSFAVFRESARINQGETVVGYGFPLSGLLASAGNVSTGLVTAVAGLRDNPRQMQISAPVQPGNSGGPLVDSKGLVIGVIVAKLNAIAVARITEDIPQNVNFAIKASSVKNLLDASSVKFRSERPQRDLSMKALTQQIKGYTVKIECN